MIDFRIYENPFGYQEAVKQGWSWPAFIFGGFWALWKKLWLIGSITVFIYLVLFVIQEFLSWLYFFKYLSIAFIKPIEGLLENYRSFALFRNIFFLIVLIISIFFGKHGNKWRERNLISRGFEFKGTVKAETAEGAIAQHFKKKKSKEENRDKESSFKSESRREKRDDDRRWAPKGYFKDDDYSTGTEESFKFKSDPGKADKKNDEAKWTPPEYRVRSKRGSNMIGSTLRNFKSKFNGKFGEMTFSMTSRMMLSTKHHVYSDIVLKTGDGTTQIDQVIVSNYGIFVIEIKTYRGWIYGGEHQKKWYQVFNKNSKYPFMNPIHQNWLHIKALKETMKYNLHKDAFKTVILFSGEVKLKSDFPDFVVKGLNYIDYIKSFKEEILTDIEVNYVIERMKEFEATSKDHKKHIEKIREERNVNTDSVPNCPSCKKPMKLRVVTKGPRKGKRFWGCSDYPRCRKTFECMN